MTEVAENLNTQAIAFAARGLYNESIACFTRAITIERENYLLWYNLGITYRDAGRLEAAKQALSKAVSINEEDEDTLDAIALVCYSKGDILDALSYVTQGLETNPFNPKFWNTFGVLYFKTEQYEAASFCFEQAVMLNPYYYDALFNLRDTYRELGNEKGAAECNLRLKRIKDKN